MQFFCYLKVQWEYSEAEDQFQPYPAEINTKLEKAYSNKEPSVQWWEEDYVNDNNILTYTVDFKTMEETGDQTTKKVHRKIITEEGRYYGMQILFDANHQCLNSVLFL